MKKCTGNNLQAGGCDAIFDVRCPGCETWVAFCEDAIPRNSPACKATVANTRKDFGSRPNCCASSPHPRNTCPRFGLSKDRFDGRLQITIENSSMLTIQFD